MYRIHDGFHGCRAGLTPAGNVTKLTFRTGSCPRYILTTFSTLYDTGFHKDDLLNMIYQGLEQERGSTKWNYPSGRRIRPAGSPIPRVVQSCSRSLPCGRAKS